MRIGIDACLILSERRGSGEYVYRLIENLLKIDKENKYILFYNFVREGKKRKEIIKTLSAPNLENKVYRIPGYIFEFLWKNLCFPPLDLMLGRLDLFHHPFCFNPPPVSTRWVITVQDLLWCRFPQYHTAEEIKWHERTYQRVKKDATFIITTSQTNKKDLIDFLNIPIEKIRVIPLGVDINFFPFDDKEFIQQRLMRFGIKRPYLLCIGGAHWNENSPRLIEAFAQVNKKLSYAYQLVMVGKKSWFRKNLIIEEIKKRKLENEIILTGYVSEEDLVYLYNGANCLVQPSLWEGFGLPAIEAMACGIPVIASNISAFREVAQDAALLVDPYNIEEIAEAMEKVCSDEALRQQMVSKGLLKAKPFSWEKTAHQTLAVYQEAVNM